MQIRKQRAMGFTLVEILVVTAIIAVLILVSLPALEGARDSARGSLCSNNLRQIVSALVQHHDAQGVFPSNGGWDGVQTIPTVAGGSTVVSTQSTSGRRFCWGVGDPAKGPRDQTGCWAYCILPYIEQRNIHEHQSWSTAVSMYHCPSRRQPESQIPVNDLYGSYEGGGWTWGRTDYATNGLFVEARPNCSRVAEVTDGSSNTIIIGEKAMDPKNYSTGTWFWDEPYFTGGSHATSRLGVDVIPDFPGIDFKENWGSPHASGAFFGFVDGSVRLIKHGTSSTMLTPLMTPHGGEMIAE